MHLQGSLASFCGNYVPYPHPYLLIGQAPAIFLLCIEGVNIRRRAVRPPQEPVAQRSMSNLDMDNTVWSAVGLRGQGGSRELWKRFENRCEVHSNSDARDVVD